MTPPSAAEDAVAPTPRRVPWWAWTLLGVVLAVALIALAGGFADVPVRKVPRIAVGENHLGVEIDARVDGVSVTAIRPGTGTPAPEGREFLVVEARLLNRGAGPSFLVGDSIRLVADGLVEVGDEPAAVVEGRRGEPLTFLQPGLSTPVAYVWEIPVDAAVPSRVVVGILERYRVSDNPIFDDAYGPLTAVARVVTAVDPAQGGAS